MNQWNSVHKSKKIDLETSSMFLIINIRLNGLMHLKHIFCLFYSPLGGWSKANERLLLLTADMLAFNFGEESLFQFKILPSNVQAIAIFCNYRLISCIYCLNGNKKPLRFIISSAVIRPPLHSLVMVSSGEQYKWNHAPPNNHYHKRSLNVKWT